MPVKDSLETAETAIRAVVNSGYTLCVYDDYSTPENATLLDRLQAELGFCLVHICEHTDHPSPNYRWVLIEAQKECVAKTKHLVIIESDVTIQPDTISRLCERIRPGVGMIAAVTTDKEGKVNFPYEYAAEWQEDRVCKKRLSFCCTLLTNELLQAYDFAQLDTTKNWYDVTISHLSQKMGLENILQMTNPVLHTPHSSRPWKKLKYTHPLRYYWNKLIYRRDRI